MKKPYFQNIIASFIVALFLQPTFPYMQIDTPAAYADESWQREFLDVCSKTDEAMTFSKDELLMLIKRCGLLKPQIEALEETPRKVYLKRLDKCMKLYQFVFDSKGFNKN